MCGIAGIIELNGREINPNELLVLQEKMSERGPDAAGLFRHENIGFVHTRLSIIDLSEFGSQPMTVGYNGTKYTIVLNGEIYNYVDLRNKFLSAEIKLKGTSDTEVLLWLYIIHGSKVFADLRGMFAFAIYDEQKKLVVLARDHFGKKPLYLHASNDRFLFSSDIKGIKAITPELTVNFKALNYYLTELTVPQPQTIWNEITQLEPGNWMQLDIKTKKINTESFFKFSFQEKIELDFNDALKLVEFELQKSIQKRQMADVPIGYFLSGGVDSGLIVAMAASQSKISTYSVGYDNSEMSELIEAKQVAQRYQTNHHEIILKPNVENDLEEIINYFGEPFADASAIPSFYIGREMKKNVSVAISGDGGDEIFGYPSYGFYHEADLFSQNLTVKQVRNKIWRSRFLSKIDRSAKNYGMYRTLFADGDKGALFRRGMAFNENSLGKLFSSADAICEIGFTANYLNEIWKKNSQKSIADTVFFGSFGTRLLNDYLVKVDRMGMKNGLEIRSPFLDVDFAMKMMTISNAYKFKEGQPKYILKKLAEKWVHTDIAGRSKKGFGVPINSWMKNELKSKVDHYLNEKRINARGIFNSKYVLNLKNSFYGNQTTTTYELWSLLCLEIWFEKNVK